MSICNDLKKPKKEIIENLEKKWTYFILEKKVLGQFFGMKKVGCYFLDLWNICEQNKD